MLFFKLMSHQVTCEEEKEEEAILKRIAKKHNIDPEKLSIQAKNIYDNWLNDIKNEKIPDNWIDPITNKIYPKIFLCPLFPGYIFSDEKTMQFIKDSKKNPFTNGKVKGEIFFNENGFLSELIIEGIKIIRKSLNEKGIALLKKASKLNEKKEKESENEKHDLIVTATDYWKAVYEIYQSFPDGDSEKFHDQVFTKHLLDCLDENGCELLKKALKLNARKEKEKYSLIVKATNYLEEVYEMYRAKHQGKLRKIPYALLSNLMLCYSNHSNRIGNRERLLLFEAYACLEVQKDIPRYLVIGWTVRIGKGYFILEESELAKKFLTEARDLTLDCINNPKPEDSGQDYPAILKNDIDPYLQKIKNRS
ncbi:hypothetical protein ACFLZV_01945 [Candidatus Margulisiibacteriota bacterium]